MDLTRRLFLELLTVPLLLPAGAAEGAGLPPAGDDLPAFSEFAESQFATPWDQTP